MTSTLTPLVGNPLLDVWRELVEPDPLMPGWTDYKETRRWLDGDRTAIFDSPYAKRREFCARWSWAIPTEAVIARLARHAVVEVGAGTGYWAALIARAGGDVVAFDREPVGGPVENGWHPTSLGPAHPYHPIATADSIAAGEHPERTLLLCWPPSADPMAYEALVAYEHAGGRRVMFVGEPYGCTGDEQFHDRLREGWSESWTHYLPTWPGIRDYATEWIR